MSQASKLLVIIGITGQQGSSVYKQFKDEPGWRIRGITRNPAKAAHLKADNVELVAADLDDEASLRKAFDGANAIFSVTDFWQFLNQPATFQRAEAEGKRPNEIAMALEIEQGKNVVRAAAAQLATLELLVLSTLSDTIKWTKGEIKHNYHFDGKAEYTKYLKEQHPELAKKTSYLMVGYYTSNWKTFPVFNPKKQENGSFIFPFYAPDGYNKMTYTDPARDTGHYAKALFLKNPPGTSMIGSSEALSNEEYVEIWGRVLGVKAKAQYLDFDALVAGGMPDWLALETEDTGNYVSKYGETGGDPEVKEPGELGVDLRKLTSVEEAIREDDWSSVL